MARQVRLDNLREKDPQTLGVLVQDVLGMPITQIHPLTLVDLLAISEVEDLPKTLERDLKAFATRFGQQLADLPDGGVLEDFLKTLDGLPAEQIPQTLRDAFVADTEREGRGLRGREALQAKVDGWAETEAADVTLGSSAPKIQRAPAASRRGESSSSSRGSTRRRSGSTAGSTTRASSSNYDPDREKWISEACLERLAPYRENGLKEMVLVAGIRHQAKEVYPDLQPYEITKVLKSLANGGHVRHSAGRWTRLGKLW